MRVSRDPSGLQTIFFRRDATDQQDNLTIRIAESESERRRANVLLNRMYAWRGYGTNFTLQTSPNSATFTAGWDDDVVGTLSLTVDSAAGLAVERTFADEIQRFRAAPGASLCELTKFAFDTSSPARPRLAALFHTIFIYGTMHHNCTDLFIEVNPRHCRFYEAMLCFSPVGEPRTNVSVEAPSQLMWLDVSAIGHLIEKHRNAEAKRHGSLYSHFFSCDYEEAVRRRLAEGTNRRVFFKTRRRAPDATVPPGRLGWPLSKSQRSPTMNGRNKWAGAAPRLPTPGKDTEAR